MSVKRPKGLPLQIEGALDGIVRGFLEGNATLHEGSRNDLRMEIIKLYEAAIKLEEAARHWSVCDFPDEVDFRCEGCNAARRAIGDMG